MLSNEERNRLVKTYEKFPDAGKVAEIYSVSSSSVYRLVRQLNNHRLKPVELIGD